MYYSTLIHTCQRMNYRNLTMISEINENLNFQYNNKIIADTEREKGRKVEETFEVHKENKG